MAQRTATPHPRRHPKRRTKKRFRKLRTQRLKAGADKRLKTVFEGIGTPPQKPFRPDRFQIDADNPTPVSGKLGGIKQPGTRSAAQIEDFIPLFDQLVLLLNLLQFVHGAGRKTFFFRPARIMILPLFFFI